MVQPPDIESITPQMTIGGKRIPLEVMLPRLPAEPTHICRHSFGTLALMASGDLSTVQAALGHSDIRETQRYVKVVTLMDGKNSSRRRTLSV